ncbi:23S rRNA (pseudouridine(1915)-N(3))-methyltransferase RlmH [Campylobacter sp. MG1]|uniref:23S rRNA (pseudouridine(1915)-N(3))-methyltransferase RlmH n=1 Tax=Campylobacter sp. MG1 TaxID=2976332 RepID=UPI00226CEAA2|nr:23S rRNA (pseudouridine(1915)-N(3))-methyltransferase RlmH [Campylobacter sp. MG1]
MNLNIYYIQKKIDTNERLENKYIKLISQFAKININNIFSKQIAKAHEIGINEAKAEYTKAYSQYKKNYSIALSENGKNINSFEFANLLKDKNEINFFIGGAYGFNDEFLNSCDYVVSLSKLTFSHELARILLLEQIYRGICINKNHPYHK